MTDERPIAFTHGLPETVLPEPPAAARHALAQALAQPAEAQRDAIAAVVVANPRFLDGWAELGDRGRDTIERYAAYRVGYHRGLDALRASGWRGSGFVRSTRPTNLGFLRCLRGLGAMAAAIGETDEAERIDVFVQQLDP